jgi:hypothetical protein
MNLKLKPTFSLVGIFAVMAAFLYVNDHGVPDLSSVPGLSSWGPKLKVEYGYFMTPAFDCPGGHCQQPSEKRLKVQSLSEQPILIKDLIVNDRGDCVFFNLAKGRTMYLGDVSYVATMCEPIRVRVVTDQGEMTFNMR